MHSMENIDFFSQRCLLLFLQVSSETGGLGGRRRLLQQPASSPVSTNAKLLFLFRNITEVPSQMILSGLQSPGYASALGSAGFDASVKILWTADEFPFFDEVTSNVVYPSGNLAAGPAPAPTVQLPIGRVHKSPCTDNQHRRLTTWHDSAVPDLRASALTLLELWPQPHDRPRWQICYALMYCSVC